MEGQAQEAGPLARPMSAIRLLTPELSVLDAALEGEAVLARALRLEVAESWNGFPEALQRTRDAVAAHPPGARWGVRLFLAGDPPALVGWGGFKGPPKGGAVELGYEIAPSRRGRGHASAAVRTMLSEAFAAPEVTTVLAHTLPEPGASVRVLEKAGFVREGEARDDEVGTAWRFRLDRAAL